ncbi:MAG: AbrB family transcriptional regulator [Salinarimonas sp.]|nr:AbrB family transcriptional regulator [Salinarimonas sp.]
MLRLLITLAVGFCGGIIAEFINSPLPFLLGSIFAVSVFQICSSKAMIYVRFRQIGQLILGAAIGLYFSKEVALNLIGDFGLMIGIAIISVAFAGIVGLFISYFSNISRTTAYFATMPGGVSEMSNLAERFGGDPGVVAFSQSIRLVAVVFVVPIGLSFFIDPPRMHNVAEENLIASNYRYFMIGMIILTAVLFSIIFENYRVMNSWFLGGLLAGAIFAFNGTSPDVLPLRIIDFGQLLIGCALGTRFYLSVIIELRRVVLGLMLGSALLILGGVLFSIVVSYLFDRLFPTILLAMAPGGVAEMGITARVLLLDVPAVTAFHLVRIIIIVTMSGLVFRLFLRYWPR